MKSVAYNSYLLLKIKLVLLTVRSLYTRKISTHNLVVTSIIKTLA